MNQPGTLLPRRRSSEEEGRMSADARSSEHERYVRSQARKILDLLVKVAPIPQGAKEAYKVSRETEKALTMAQKSFDSGYLSASDENMNGLSHIARRLSAELSTLSRYDENWWLET